MIRILIAANHTLTRSDIRSLLAGRPDIQVVGEARDGIEALQLIQQHQPDVVLMDIPMPMMNGLETARRAKAQFPDVRVVIISMYTNEEFVLRALRVGAEAYLANDAGGLELENAILSVVRGETYVCPKVSRVLVNYVRRTARELQPIERLTRRQREVLQLIAEGKTTKEIAQILGISVKTVETHRSRLMEELDLHDVAGVVRYAIRSGVIEPHN